MKTIFIFLIFSLVTAAQVFSQPHAADKRIISPQLLQQQAKFKITGHSEDTSARVSRIGGFRLKSGEKNAVVQTGADITRIDQSYEGLARDTSGKMQVFMLPELYFTRVEGTTEQVSYRILFMDSAPLRYDTSSRLFETTLSFLPREESAGSGGSLMAKTLATPEQIFVTYGYVKIPLSLGQLNWPPVDMTISLADPKDSVMVRILTINNPAGYPKSLHVEPAVFLTSNRVSMNGFGIQTIPLHLSLKGVTSSSPVPVTLEPSIGSVKPDSLVLVNDRSQVATLRSEWLGDMRVKAVSSNYQVTPPLVIHAVFPWLFLLFSILGGFIGALTRILRGKRRITIRPLAYGTLSGFIVSLAYWGVGIMLITIPFTFPVFNEVAVLVLSMIAGYLELGDFQKSKSPSA